MSSVATNAPALHRNTIPDGLRRSALKYRGRTALTFAGRTWSFAEIDAAAGRVAHRLAGLGLKKGDRVAIVVPEGDEFVLTFLGAVVAGIVPVPIYPRATFKNLDGYVDTLAHVAGAAKARVLVTMEATKPYVEKVLERGVGVEKLVLIEELFRGDPPPFTAPELGPEDLCFLQFTSGSTNKPKGVVVTHANVVANGTSFLGPAGLARTPDDVGVSWLPLFHDMGLIGFVIGPLFTNIQVAFLPTANFVRAPRIWLDTLSRHRGTITYAPNFAYQLVSKRVKEKDLAGLDLSCVRFHLSAGEALPPALLERFTGRFGNDVYDGIGSAEMFHIYASNRPGDVKPGSLGKVVAGYELRVLPEDAEGPGATPCAPGEIGVLWVKGDSVSQGYWLDRDKSWKTFHGHWCRTGDLFRIDEAGYLYFAGRADELLKVGGQWVAPVEVEECLMRHPAVQLAAVIGVEEDGLVKTKAYVVLRAGGPAASDAALGLVPG